jgi:hypothetical protein
MISIGFAVASVFFSPSSPSFVFFLSRCCCLSCAERRRIWSNAQFLKQTRQLQPTASIGSDADGEARGLPVRL